MKSVRGMTLLEIMVAVAILGILTSVAVVNFQTQLINQRENEATRSLWSSALAARQRAIATNQPVRIVVENNVAQADGSQRTVARWERLACGNTWDNGTCPMAACLSTTCRTNATCCNEVGQDIVLPRTMTATELNGLCFLPGTGRAVTNMACPQNAAIGPITARFLFSSNRARSVLSVEPLTGLSNVLDCDSQYVATHPETACTTP
ncbi:pilus assembly protein [Corallococcus sp. H22C18031201]|uniref:pilus assembly FimT family protein n=1 Tax=Citreicoccus inhibens TaxID=2849499 RepID=UPI000E747890|nr:type II secretion system protein [Citreicoccus inhibens]MBU8896359.1 type II secretion system GspH family protein [Citreicoccus inhibens]RJS17321.1 pilus assembly protein [Corallococcus sp. H22C18031201]